MTELNLITALNDDKDNNDSKDGDGGVIHDGRDDGSESMFLCLP